MKVVSRPTPKTLQGLIDSGLTNKAIGRQYSVCRATIGRWRKEAGLDPKRNPYTRFWSMVEKVGHPNGCWTWTGYKTSCGYGTFSYKGQTTCAHRVAWRFTNGPIPDKLQLDHLCRNPACVNPAHLEPVTSLENARRARYKRYKAHCKHGHELSGDNLYISPKGTRGCRVCRATLNLKRYRT